MSHAIFRVQGIKTTSDLRGIGKHNLDRISLTNDDIDESRSSENIHLIQSDESYLKKFFKTVEPMKQEHDEKMKTERKDRLKSFEAKVNSAKNDIACEFLFTSNEKFFEGKSKAEITEWAEQSLDFVKKEIGIDEKNILHAIVHMDEKTPHLHVVAVPLVNNYDGRAKRNVWQINRKHFIRTKNDMSILQDKYFEHMKSAGHNLQRGEKGTERRHLSVDRFKAESLQKEIKTLQNDREGLQGERKALQEDVQALIRAVDVSKTIDSIKVDKGGLFDRGSVKMSAEDFEAVKKLALAAEGLKRENGLLHKEIDVLQKTNAKQQMRSRAIADHNGDLIAENKKLKQVVKSYEKVIDILKKTLEVAKISSEKHLGISIDRMQSYIGSSRLHVLFSKLGIQAFEKENLERNVPTDEMPGAEKYIEGHKKRNPQSRKPERPKMRARNDFER